jgi:hypothetical protein
VSYQQQEQTVSYQQQEQKMTISNIRIYFAGTGCAGFSADQLTDAGYTVFGYGHSYDAALQNLFESLDESTSLPTVQVEAAYAEALAAAGRDGSSTEEVQAAAEEVRLMNNLPVEDFADLLDVTKLVLVVSFDVVGQD